MESDFTITKRDYMCIIARYSTWCIEHKINDDNVTKDDIDKFIAYMSISKPKNKTSRSCFFIQFPSVHKNYHHYPHQVQIA